MWRVVHFDQQRSRFLERSCRSSKNFPFVSLNVDLQQIDVHARWDGIVQFHLRYAELLDYPVITIRIRAINPALWWKNTAHVGVGSTMQLNLTRCCAHGRANQLSAANTREQFRQCWLTRGKWFKREYGGWIRQPRRGTNEVAFVRAHINERPVLRRAKNGGPQFETTAVHGGFIFLACPATGRQAKPMQPKKSAAAFDEEIRQNVPNEVLENHLGCRFRATSAFTNVTFRRSLRDNSRPGWPCSVSSKRAQPKESQIEIKSPTERPVR